jgi:hypothetical protein
VWTGSSERSSYSQVFRDRRHKHASRHDDAELAQVLARDIDELGVLVDRAR